MLYAIRWKVRYMETKQRVCVLLGGDSPEREVSIKSGQAVIAALSSCGYEIVAVDPFDGRLEDRLKQISPGKVFIALHGGDGENGTIQRLLEKLKIPYTGSDSKASWKAMHKGLSRAAFIENNIMVPKGWVFKKGESVCVDWSCAPFVLKPACGGSSIGLCFIEKEDSFEKALHQAFDYSEELVIEQLIKGKELTVGILNNKPLPVIEIVPKAGVFDFHSKYTKGMTEYLIPARLTRREEENAQAIALRCHEVLGCRNFSRVDMMYSGNGQWYVLEVNTIPGLTETSLLPKAAAKVGIDFARLCTIMVEKAQV